MGQLGQFILNHWALWLMFLGVLILIVINEGLDKKHQAKTLSTAKAVDMINHESAVVIDLRDAETYRSGHIIDSICAPSDDFNQKRMEKYKSKPLILVCARGLQSATLAKKLRTQGFTTPMVLAGGIAAWQAASLPLVKGK